MTRVVSAYRDRDYIVQILHKTGGYTWRAVGDHGDMITSKRTWRRFEDAADDSAKVMAWSDRHENPTVRCEAGTMPCSQCLAYRIARFLDAVRSAHADRLCRALYGDPVGPWEHDRDRLADSYGIDRELAADLERRS